uniref:Ankyrin repeat domain-containing protein 54 n=1 Tax=Daphnia galeata TaxID=27404 RepID=A0A8J2RS09_9CRUS|nr:unnamed protein product [Daphnia galeata]
MIKIWRRVLRQVPVNYSPPVPCPLPSTDPQSITYADCEAFFEIVTEGSRKDILNLLNTHGPEVITELSKSYNEHGETPLLVSIKKGNVDMVKYLVGQLDVPIGQIGRFVWKGVEYLDVPALYVAIVRGEMGIAAYLLSKEVESNQTRKIIDSIISSPNERQVKINMLELMGAINFYFYQSDPARQNGLIYWREAMNLRQPTIDGEPAMPKTLLPSDLGLFTSEFTTFEQLEELTVLEFFIQAILFSQRVQNTISPGPHICTLIFMCRCAWIYSSWEGYRGRALCILTFILQQSQELQWKEYKKSSITNWALDIMMRIITNLRQKRYNPSQEELTVANLMATFDFATNHMSALLEKDQPEVEPDTLNHLANFISEMIFLLNEMMPQFNWEQRKQFERSLSLYIRKDHRWGPANRNLLHTICDCSSQMPPPVRAPLATNDQLNDLIDNADDVLNFSNDIESDTGSNLDSDSVSEFDISDEDDTGSAVGSDPRSNLDGKLDTDEDIENDIESDQESDLESDADGSDDDIDSDDSDASSNFDDSSTYVSGCPSCGHGGSGEIMSSDDETDDELFDLIKQWQSQLDNQGNPDLNLQSMIASVLPLPLSCLAAQVLRMLRERLSRMTYLTFSRTSAEKTTDTPTGDGEPEKSGGNQDCVFILAISSSISGNVLLPRDVEGCGGSLFVDDAVVIAVPR